MNRLICWALGHEWSTAVIVAAHPMLSVHSFQVCTRCRAERRTIVQAPRR